MYYWMKNYSKKITKNYKKLQKISVKNVNVLLDEKYVTNYVNTLLQK